MAVLLIASGCEEAVSDSCKHCFCCATALLTPGACVWKAYSELREGGLSGMPVTLPGL
jgi:hypothetical protein